jgi:hypothetical protein
MPLRLLTLVTLLGLLPYTTQALEIKFVKLEQITTTKNKKQERETIILDNIERHVPIFEKLLHETTVNSSVVLKDYVMLHIQKQTELLKQIHANVKPEKTQKESNFTIKFSSGLTIEFKNVYRDFNLTGYFDTDFADYLIKNGVKSKDSTPNIKDDIPKSN